MSIITLTTDFGSQSHFVAELKGKIAKILIDDKTHIVERNKKYLVGKIYNFISDDFPDYDEKIVRRTIKKFLDLIVTN